MSINPNVIGMDYVALMVFLWMIAALDYQKRIKDDFILETANTNAYLIRIAFLILGAMAAFRSLEITNDTNAYYTLYNALSYYGTSSINRIEKGYLFLNEIFLYLFKNTKTGFHVLQIVIAAFSYYSVERYLENRSSSYGVCVLVFYSLLNGGFMSAMRQSVAIAIVLLAIELLRQKNTSCIFLPSRSRRSFIRPPGLHCCSCLYSAESLIIWLWGPSSLVQLF